MLKILTTTLLLSLALKVEWDLARTIESLKKNKSAVKLLPLDVSDPASLKACVAAVEHLEELKDGLLGARR